MLETLESIREGTDIYLESISDEEIEEEYQEFIEFLDSGLIFQEGILDVIKGKLAKKIQFIRGIASTVGAKIKDLIMLFKDKKVFKFFALVGWNLKKLFKIIKKGAKVFDGVATAISDYIASTKVAKWTTKELAKLDAFLKKHPKTARIVGIGIAGLLLYIWFNMTFTGSFDYDFDFADILAALAGRATLATIFGGPAGIKLLMLFATGALLGLSFPWPGPNTIKFISAVMYSIGKKIKARIDLPFFKAQAGARG